MRMVGRLVRPHRFCYGNIISRLHACAIRIFWNRYVSERNICIVGRLAVSFSLEKETASSPVPSSFTEYSATVMRYPVLQTARNALLSTLDCPFLFLKKRNGRTANNANITA